MPSVASHQPDAYFDPFWVDALRLLDFSIAAPLFAYTLRLLWVAQQPTTGWRARMAALALFVASITFTGVGAFGHEPTWRIWINTVALLLAAWGIFRIDPRWIGHRRGAREQSSGLHDLQERIQRRAEGHGGRHES